MLESEQKDQMGAILTLMIAFIIAVFVVLGMALEMASKARTIKNMKAHAVEMEYGRYDIDPYGESTFHWNPPNTNYPSNHPFMEKVY